MQVGQMTSSPVNRRDSQKRVQMLQGVPAAYGRFQEVLDRFEVELVRDMTTSRAKIHGQDAYGSNQIRARAVMRRDLAKCRAAREQREKAAQEKSMLAINHEPAPEQDTKNVESEKLPVTTTKDEPQQSTTIASVPSAPPTSALTTKTAQEEESSSLPATTTLTNPVPPGTSTSVSAAPQTSTSAPTAPPLSVTLPTDTFSAASPSATAADMQDIDFDSMFEDLENAEPGDLVFGQTDANVDVADVNSLLTGIDTYINIQDADVAGGGTTGSDSQTQKVEGGEVGDLDFDMLGLPGGEDGQKQESDLQFGDNNFDELFEFGEWAAGEGSGEGDGGLDENWLKNLE